MERVKATYWIETSHHVDQAAEALAGEQSSGTFLAVPGETIELKAKFNQTIFMLVLSLCRIGSECVCFGCWRTTRANEFCTRCSLVSTHGAPYKLELQ